MLERLRMQEVSQIILSVPEGAVIAGTNLRQGEPVMIINKPSTSKLIFNTRPKKAEDGRGFIGASGQTQTLDFTINEGSVLYALWSYLHGVDEERTVAQLKGTEWLEADSTLLQLSTTTEPKDLILYYKDENGLILMEPELDYTLVKNTANGLYYIQIIREYENVESYFTTYMYNIEDVQVTTLKQIHNNVFCSMDIYFDAVDINTDDKHVVCIHCDKVQVFTDLAIGINNSTKTSFTPISIQSIPEGTELNKNIATVTVI